MARIQTKKSTFSRGVISEKLSERDDLELYTAALANGSNFIVDGRGGLEKRPGTMHLGNTKGDGFATLLPFAYSRTQSYLVEAGHLYFRFHTNYSQLMAGAAPYEIATPYAGAQVEQISFAQSNDIMFLCCEGHKYSRLARTSATTFQLASFDTFDGPYDDMNPDPLRTLTVAIGTPPTITASGFAPFTADMVGRWIRVRSTNTDSPDANQLGDEFLWDIFKITAVVSSTVVQVDQANGAIPATADWRMGAFYKNSWPDVVTMHMGRLTFAKENRVWLSKPQDFNNFSPTYHSPEGGATGRVEPDSSISVVIDSGLSQQGAVTKVLWMKSQNFQLVLGTPVGVITIQSTSLGEALTPANAVVRAQDARGASRTLPVTVNESTIFVHSTGMRLQGTYYRDGALDRLGAQDLSLSSDTLITDQIRRLAWQDYPHGAVWMAMNDGRALALSVQPEEKVQGMVPQRLGGEYINRGQIEHPHVEAVMSLPSPAGTRDDIYLIVRRTINGVARRFIEVMWPYWNKGDDVRDAWFLDSGLRYEGNDDISKTITMAGNSPNAPYTLTPNFQDPAFVPGEKFSIHDGRRWHRGTILSVAAGNVAQWLPAAPNAPPGPADGLRWFFDQATEQWVRPARRDPRYFRPTENTYESPAMVGVTWRWSSEIQQIAGLDHLEGQTVRGLIDGVPTLEAVVTGGMVDFGASGTSITVGLPYESSGRLLPINEGAQAGTADEKQRPIYSVGVSVWETWGLECGTGEVSTYEAVWEQFSKTIFPDAFAEGEPPRLFTGTKMFARNEQGAELGGPTNPAVTFRHAEPLPCYVRSIITRLSTSDGA